MSILKKATIISSLTAFCLAVLKLVVWIISGSVAILSSAIDSLLDMFVSLFNLFAVSSSQKAPDKKFNYWRGKVEALASFLEWFVIAISGLYIFYESIRKIIFKEHIEFIDLWIYVMIFSVIITALLVYFLDKIAKKTKNIVIEADSLHYKTDLLSNIWILIWIFIIYFTNLYILDSLIGMVIATYIIMSSFKIIKKWYLLIIDVSLENEEVNKIKDIIVNHPKILSLHLFKSRKSWNFKFVESHIVFWKDMLLSEAHSISHEIEDSIMNLDKNSKWNITLHLDPYDDSKKDRRV